MPPTLATRKPIEKLDAADLRAFPVWEYAIDEEGNGEQDETLVRPVDSVHIPKGQYSQIVAADFLTASGRKLNGFMIVTAAKRAIEIGPGAIIGRAGYLPLPALSRSDAARDAVNWDLELRDGLLIALGEPESDVFPLRYSLRSAIQGERNRRSDIMP